MLFPIQFGFRKGFSTVHALMSLNDIITLKREENLYTCAIFLDLKKAYDTVDHSILTKRLSFFASYLSNRKQLVTTYTCKSDKEYVTCGIPQGNVLGPTLFLIHINDLPDCHAVQILLFADDTALLMSGPNILDLQNTINDELKNVRK